MRWLPTPFGLSQAVGSAIGTQNKAAIESGAQVIDQVMLQGRALLAAPDPQQVARLKVSQVFVRGGQGPGKALAGHANIENFGAPCPHIDERSPGDLKFAKREHHIRDIKLHDWRFPHRPVSRNLA